MDHITHLQQFSKGQKTSKKNFNRNAVIYTRVSSKEQAETNKSLETQKKYCLEYSLKNDLNILGFFGGTYEGAKTDERNEFNRMIRFVRNQKEGVSTILVYSLDRFSRTGDNAIFISSELKKRGISIVSVTQPIDVSTGRHIKKGKARIGVGRIQGKSAFRRGTQHGKPVCENKSEAYHFIRTVFQN